MMFLRRMSVAVVFGLLGTLCGAASAQAASAPAAPVNPALPTLLLVGNADPGVGPALQPLFDPSKINVVDRSIAADSVRATAENGSWAATLAMVRPGDFVFIQFRRTPGPAGETESLPGVSDDARRIPGAATSSSDQIVQSYGWYLRRYAVEVIARGATPILCAPLITDSTEQSREEEWTKAIAVQQRIPFADAAAATAARGAAAGVDATAIVAGLKGLPNDPLSGYFSGQGRAVPPYRPPPPSPGAAPTAPPL